MARTRSLLRHLDASAVSAAARRESRNREHHLPSVSCYRWWARRTAAVCSALSECATRELARQSPLDVLDPFSGGGVIPLTAMAAGHRVHARDINPWATLGLRAATSLPPVARLVEAEVQLEARATPLITRAYATRLGNGLPAQVSHTLRVVRSHCGACGESARLFPHAMVSLLARKEQQRPDAFLACPAGHLFIADNRHRHRCPECRRAVDPRDIYQPRRRIRCHACDSVETLEQRASAHAWAWEVALVERVAGRQRELGPPTNEELVQANADSWRPGRQLGAIPQGRETRVLLRHGFHDWSDLYPRRQQQVTEDLLKLCDQASSHPDVHLTLRMAVIGSVEMAGHLSRWDRFYLKSYEAMAGHRFNLTTLAVEPNVWGAKAAGRGTVTRRLRSMRRAAAWSHGLAAPGSCTISEGSSESLPLATASVDLALTDPPYHDDVCYGELSAPLRAWAGLETGALVGEAVAPQGIEPRAGTRHHHDLLSRIFRETARTLRPDGHLVFSYANRDPLAWVDLLSALQDAGLHAMGFAIVHSENERDYSKRHVRSCNLDMLLDLVPAGSPEIEQLRPTPLHRTDEESMLLTVGDTFLQVGQLEPGWRERLTLELEATAFLESRKTTSRSPKPQPSARS